ncbi:hypothetical protein L6164_033452 [Bauhinia variegata]|uniref:Uncharacterized protein n=1 Tax=Bauhinia variegata TaxID=167791 RepID=A0ACB9KS50_BAUVA|nr:hypothetical protein L6164_033452 [Bauhinia variegata]
MVNQVKYIDNCGEVVPALIIYQHQKSSKFSKLEPIIEEDTKVSELSKKIVISLPLLFSGIFCICLYVGVV